MTHEPKRHPKFLFLVSSGYIAGPSAPRTQNPHLQVLPAKTPFSFGIPSHPISIFSGSGSELGLGFRDLPPTMASSSAIEIDEEIEGEQVGTSDYFFERIGEPVPIKPSPFGFDSQSLPTQPLAVSEGRGLVFLALSSGVYRLSMSLSLSLI